MPVEKFIEKARLVHGELYNYSKVEYKNAHTKVLIICPIHGEWAQTPYVHTNNKCGCFECGRIKRSITRKVNAGK